MASSTLPGFRRPEAARRGLASRREREGHETLEMGFFGLALFIASEVMFFAGLFGAYFNFKAGAKTWPMPTIDGRPIEPLSVSYAGKLTVVLVLSSLTMQASIWAVRRGASRLSKGLVALTILLGLGFIAGQANEWIHLDFNIREGIYPSLFYTITGFHGLHVIGGLIALMFVMWKSLAGAFSPDNYVMMESVSFYWHFVDVVWIGVFSTLYILR